MKIILQFGSISKDLISQFQTVDFGATFDPVVVKVHPNDQFITLGLPLADKYANIRVDSNGSESCTNYIANFHNNVGTFSCAMIIIRAQDALGLLKGIPRSILIAGSFNENDLRTDGINISFTGENTNTSANKILFQPNLSVSTNLIDITLFRTCDGGQVTLTNIFIQRSNTAGSENAPIAMNISGIEQNSGIVKSSPGQLVINKCFLEGGNSVDSDVWYNLGLAETCNVGYGADGQNFVQISGSMVRTFEGPAVKALNGASVQITRETILNNNGLRNRNTLSSMQTNAVCEGGIGTTTVNVAFDNITSLLQSGNGWIFSPSGSNCAINATLNDERALPRSIPQMYSAKISINNSDQQAEARVEGKFLEPCMRRLVLEIHEKDKVDVKVTQEFGYEISSASVNWIDSENIIFHLPLSVLKDLNTKTIWEVSAYEYGNRELANWASTQPVEEVKEKQKKTNLVVAIVIPIVVIIIAAVIIIILLIVFMKHKQQQKNIHQTERNGNMIDFEVISINEDEQDDKQEQANHKILQQGKVPETGTSFFTDSDTQQRSSSDRSVRGDHKTDQRHIQSKSQERQKDAKQENASKDSNRFQQYSVKRTDTNLKTEEIQMLKDEMNKKTKKQRHQSKDTRKASKQRKERNNKSKSRKDKEKRSKPRKTSKEKQSSISDSSDTSPSTITSNDSSDTKDSPKPNEYQEEEQSNNQTDNTTTSDELTSSSSSLISSYTTNSSLSNSDEKKKENKRKQTTENQRKKKKAKQTTQEDSSDSTSDNQKQNKQNDDIKVKSLDINPIAKVKNRNMRSESSAPAIQGLVVYAEIDNNVEMKYQPKDIVKSENNQKEDFVVIPSNTSLQSNEKREEYSSGSLPPSNEDMQILVVYNIPEKNL
ncbi:MAG: hypothetical protein EZS28_004828 [Streblomastix strix]|uniref:Uncharacterized protein n=1 Tax=Streblomastix strix TaxID=222440 RepID=A0A5J4WYT8_9EUKA|nr:MAG: hypothetical protein EZS28_004828 [Streblomastix strix]